MFPCFLDILLISVSKFGCIGEFLNAYRILLKTKKLTNTFKLSHNNEQNISETCVGYVQKVLKPFFKKFEICVNSETLWTTVLEK
jgi:hypothetical protein